MVLENVLVCDPSPAHAKGLVHVCNRCPSVHVCHLSAVLLWWFSYHGAASVKRLLVSHCAAKQIQSLKKGKSMMVVLLENRKSKKENPRNSSGNWWCSNRNTNSTNPCNFCKVFTNLPAQNIKPKSYFLCGRCTRVTQIPGFYRAGNIKRAQQEIYEDWIHSTRQAAKILKELTGSPACAGCVETQGSYTGADELISHRSWRISDK